MDDLTTRVERGANLLDRYFGDVEWRGRIDLETLNLGNVRKCVLGQLFGDYDTGTLELGEGIAIDDAVYGFNAHTRFEEYPELTEAWRDYLYADAPTEEVPAHDLPTFTDGFGGDE